jgi:hypothetical protein
MKKEKMIKNIFRHAADSKTYIPDTWSVDEFDTSCPYVPFGFVRTISVPKNKIDSEEEFWGQCLSTDENLDLLTAEIVELDGKRVADIVNVIAADISRVGKSHEMKSFDPKDICLSVENSCKYCCGSVLLGSTSEEFIYVHWHRES